MNGHHPVAAQRHALDLVVIAPWRRARGFLPRDVRAYHAYGARVCSPCDGEVSRVVDGIADQAPGTMDASGPAGNHVVLATGSGTLLLAHLAAGSIVVRAGQRVAAGDTIGSVGNGANTSEPHVHVHLERDGIGMPLTIGGRYLVRNDVLRSAPPARRKPLSP